MPPPSYRQSAWSIRNYWAHLHGHVILSGRRSVKTYGEQRLQGVIWRRCKAIRKQTRWRHQISAREEHYSPWYQAREHSTEFHWWPWVSNSGWLRICEAPQRIQSLHETLWNERLYGTWDTCWTALLTSCRCLVLWNSHIRNRVILTAISHIRSEIIKRNHRG